MSDDREIDEPRDVVDVVDDVPVAEPVRTGVGGVDSVIAGVEALEDRPIEEHVGVFEDAHDRLRRALDHQPPDPA